MFCLPKTAWPPTLSQYIPAEQLTLAQQQIGAYWSMPWPNSLLGVVERLFTLPLHLACAVLVLQSFTRNQVSWVWLAVAWHMLVDASAVFLAQIWRPFEWRAFAVEGVMGIMALISLGIIFSLRQPEPEEPQPVSDIRSPQPFTAAQLQIDLPEVTQDDLEKSKYN